MVSENNFFVIASYNIGERNCCLGSFLNVDKRDEELGAELPDVICLQECSWNARLPRIKMMGSRGYRLLGQTRGGKRDSINICKYCYTKSSVGESEADYVCLETYVRDSAREDKRIVLDGESFRTSNCSHEVLYDLNAIGDDWQSKRRHHILACKVKFYGEEVWILNIHLPAGGNYNSSSKNTWKWVIPLIEEWYSEKKLIVAGDWNFDAPAAFCEYAVVGDSIERQFEIRAEHLPNFKIKLDFNDSSTPTYRFCKQNESGPIVDKLVRLDAIAVSSSHFKMTDYIVCNDDLNEGEHGPVITKIVKNVP